MKSICSLRAVLYVIVRLIALMAVTGISGLSFAAQKHALLVGVSNYLALPERLQLRGPSNDVILMHSVLKQYGFNDKDIHVLADGVDGASLPTRQAILDELKQLAGRTSEGDFVYLHFAGHGSQQPSKPGKQPPEPDGLDEIFLPSDIGKWDGGKGEVRNAIVDSELGTYISAIRSRGAFVWAVFDACHSGSMTRGVQADEVRYRQVRPQDLGITENTLAGVQSEVVRTRGAPQAKGGALGEIKGNGGGFVAFYAAQSTETTPEEPLPVNQPDRKPHGTFTYTLAETLVNMPNISYRQAGQQILNRYGARLRHSPTPMFEGSALDAPIFGTKPTEYKPQWKLQKVGQDIKIPAGQLHQIGEGAIFLIVPSPVSADTEGLGYVQAANTKVMETALTPVAYNNKPVLVPEVIPLGSFARLIAPRLMLELTVSRPGGDKSSSKVKLLRAIDLLANNKMDGIKINWVNAGQSAGVRLAIHGERLRLLLADEENSGANGLQPIRSLELTGSPEKIAEELHSNLQRIAKASNLMRLAAEINTGSAAKQLQVTLLHQAAGTGKKTEAPPGVQPFMKAGDKIFLALRNSHSRALDVTVLFIDSDYGISAMYPPAPGDANRIEAGGKLDGDDQIVIELNDSTLGKESLLVIAVEAEPQTPMADFSFLQQPALIHRGGGVETEEQGSLWGMFEQAAYGERMRGGNKPQVATIRKTAMHLFSWRTIR